VPTKGVFLVSWPPVCEQYRGSHVFAPYDSQDERVIHNAYRIELTGESLRKPKSSSS